ncbi:hypothetical protein KOR42_44210 [Thalassoglobus neptunius]|uniref:Uncharacterized protein n=1 Tax=Thalassoglobus neptunius TaxID=1938619 RepID=A0A5C5W068_9PLAN|nr:hypothetical protein KOR42_44210 [Thalassoglobus neptunius]
MQRSSVRSFESQRFQSCSVHSQSAKLMKLFALVLAFQLSVTSLLWAESPAGPNIILIMADDK